MACNTPTSPQPTPYDRLRDQYRVITGIEPGDSEGLIIAFYLFRQRLWSVIEVAMDAHAYELSWTSINQFGRASAEALQAGNEDEFGRLQEIVTLAYQCLPMESSL